ncbi:MAG: hypothetical protein AAFX76_02710 [Planctomycetota bacterium]
MTRDRLVQLAAVFVALAALVGSALLIDPINRQRQDLQLTFAVENNQGEPPQYALLAAGLGSFRGVAVNALWYRAEMMKRDGRFAEANTLATWITYLQPRFPHVWGFLAWNMAYNISVETYTPQERWDWVSKGVSLIREQGIPYNPNAVRLYRELGWILFHKIGQSTDDVNWYYKGEFAREWEELLGAGPEVLSPQEVVNEMRTVAIYGDRYFSADGLSRAVAFALDAAIEAGEIDALTEDADAIRELSILQLNERLADLRRTVSPGDESAAALLDELDAVVADQITRAERDATTTFLEENPQARPIVEALREQGLSLNQTTLRAIGQCLMFLRFRPADVVATLPPTIMSPDAQTVLPLVVQALNAPPDGPLYAGLFGQLLPYLRAKVLIEDYNMKPTVMWRYMSATPQQVLDDDPTAAGGYGPLDWRHPHTHSLYWSRLGVEQYRDLRDDTRVDILNTQRQALHSLQSLVEAGTVAFNPFNRPGQQIDLLPDPDFIEGYLKIIDETQAMAADDEFGQRIREDAFDQGKENFLQKAVLFSYLYGSPGQAEHYFQRLKAEYGDSNTARSTGWYELDSVGDFVALLIFEEDIGRPGLIGLINSRFVEAFRKGLGVGNPRALAVFSRNLEIAQAVHNLYNEKYAYETGLNVGGGRLRLPPFEEMAFDAFTRFMQDPNHDLIVRVNAYQTAFRLAAQGLPLAPQTYRRWAPTVSEQLAAQGIEPTAAIPVPPNVVESTDGLDQRQGGETIQRQ